MEPKSLYLDQWLTKKVVWVVEESSAYLGHQGTAFALPDRDPDPPEPTPAKIQRRSAAGRRIHKAIAE
jgi:hypothetical protein